MEKGNRITVEEIESIEEDAMLGALDALELMRRKINDECNDGDVILYNVISSYRAYLGFLIAEKDSKGKKSRS